MRTIREIFKGNLKRYQGGRRHKETAAGAKISYRTYQNMLKGVIPQDATLAKIAAFYDIPQSAFFKDPDPSSDQAFTPDELRWKLVDLVAKLDHSKLGNAIALLENLGGAELEVPLKRVDLNEKE